MDNKIKSVYPSRKGWLITLGILLAFVLGVMFLQGILNVKNASEALTKINNSFFIPGVVFTGFSILSWIATTGIFDGFAYVFRNFSLPLIVPGTSPDKRVSYNEYKLEKSQKGRKWFPHLLILGGICLAVSCALTVIGALLQ